MKNASATEESLTTLSTAAVADALSEGYESIYVIDAETGSFLRYYESAEHAEQMIASSDDDFFAGVLKSVREIVHPDERERSARLLARESLMEGTENGAIYSFVHRVVYEDGKTRHHQVKASRGAVGQREVLIFVVRDVGGTVRREREQADKQQSMLQKEINHLEAIMATAAGYVEADISDDVLLERSTNRAADGILPREIADEGVSFEAFMHWWGQNVVEENSEQFLKANSTEYLLGCFARGERRASTSFSIRTQTGELLPCRQVMYLYQDKATGNVMCFSVIYDLTEQQRRDKELADLETALRMSRIRVFTGQMQPHFLYNALASIQEVVLDDPAYASELIGDFTTHLRGSIRAMSDDAPIPFKQELENVRAYANIEKMRFGDKLAVRYETEATDFKIPPLSVQPLVENAIRHGVYQRGIAGGTVTVRSRDAGEAWIVQVEDDGVGFDVEAAHAEARAGSDSTGLGNLMFRLDKIMHAAVDIRSELGAGTCVTITIPKESDSR